MNSLNILSARVIGPTLPAAPTTHRPRSYSDGSLSKNNTESKPKRSLSQHVKGAATDTTEEKEEAPGRDKGNEDGSTDAISDDISEKTPFLVETRPSSRPGPKYNKLRLAARRLVDALTESLKWVLSTLASPGVYIVAGFYNDKGTFSPLLPVRKLGRVLSMRNGTKSTAQAVGLSGSSDPMHHPATSNSDTKHVRRRALTRDLKRKARAAGSFSSASSESETEVGEKMVILNSPPETRPRPQTSSSSEEVPYARRSIRIKLYNEDSTRRRRQKRDQGDLGRGAASSGNDNQPALTVANIKSPTSPASSLRMTKYPRAQAPPRPLIPRRQPSYSAHPPSPASRLAQKTLVIDLDETLIHSLAKGGRMSSGHMVEVKLNTAVGYGGATLGPQHPILYYVHKRPHCDDFLRKVYKWYNLVVFTASVQEYADPVIDWLEQERKYFSGRYYRQHCTFRNGAYIKDLSSVEPDLSKVMILDNSPLSYIFHEGEKVAKPSRCHQSDLFPDNAIPIEGWINDPTDNDLLHLVPVLEALQYVTDVRALLALRRGEVEASH
ncbi:Nuclear envelope morphology protein 1 [Mycoblastus sanguinarius]|nr:Nuclear envelope morphology protein 1 [Mycoblastus sanguinarius]